VTSMSGDGSKIRYQTVPGRLAVTLGHDLVDNGQELFFTRHPDVRCSVPLASVIDVRGPDGELLSSPRWDHQRVLGEGQ
jgi:hypothetical protein